jgi:hypothetical protein
MAKGSLIKEIMGEEGYYKSKRIGKAEDISSSDVVDCRIATKINGN